MTTNITGNIKKVMGCCPNKNDLVEEKFLKWRPVALPGQSTKG